MAIQMICKSVEVTWTQGGFQKDILHIIRRKVIKPRHSHLCAVSDDRILGPHDCYVLYWESRGQQDPLTVFRACENHLSELEARMAKFLEQLPDETAVSDLPEWLNPLLESSDLPQI